MARTGGWRRMGPRGRFRYVDSRGNRITDEAKLARIEAPVIPPAWKEVWISPRVSVAMSEHMDHDSVDRERVSAVAVRLINLGWFRVGSERYARESRTYGITTLTGKRLNDYIHVYLGEEFTAKDFRTWGGTLSAAIALAEQSHLRVVGARDMGLDLEEQALLSLLRSWRIRQSRAAA